MLYIKKDNMLSFLVDGNGHRYNTQHLNVDQLLAHPELTVLSFRGLYRLRHIQEPAGEDKTKLAEALNLEPVAAHIETVLKEESAQRAWQVLSHWMVGNRLYTHPLNNTGATANVDLRDLLEILNKKGVLKAIFSDPGCIHNIVNDIVLEEQDNSTLISAGKQAFMTTAERTQALTTFAGQAYKYRNAHSVYAWALQKQGQRGFFKYPRNMLYTVLNWFSPLRMAKLKAISVFETALRGGHGIAPIFDFDQARKTLLMDTVATAVKKHKAQKIDRWIDQVVSDEIVAQKQTEPLAVKKPLLWGKPKPLAPLRDYTFKAADGKTFTYQEYRNAKVQELASADGEFTRVFAPSNRT